MDDEVRAVDLEQVLAVRLDVLQHPPVDDLGVGDEPPLRAGHVHRPPGVAPALQARQAVHGVAFGHGLQAARCGASPRAGLPGLPRRAWLTR